MSIIVGILRFVNWLDEFSNVKSPFGDHSKQASSPMASMSPSQSYAYEIHTNWQLFFAYGLISTLLISALVYRNRRTWKVKTVASVFCGVFVVTGATHAIFLL